MISDWASPSFKTPIKDKTVCDIHDFKEGNTWLTQANYLLYSSILSRLKDTFNFLGDVRHLLIKSRPCKKAILEDLTP